MNRSILDLVCFLYLFSIIFADDGCPKIDKIKFLLSSTNRIKGQRIWQTVLDLVEKYSCWDLNNKIFSECNNEGYGHLNVSLKEKENCTENFIKIDDDEYKSYDIGRYKLYDTLLLNWTEAKKKCESDGAHLAVVETLPETVVLKEVMEASPFDWVYIGFSYQKSEDDFIDIFGRKVQPFWSNGQPNNYGGNEYCGSVTREGLLNDLGCSPLTSFICEKP